MLLLVVLFSAHRIDAQRISGSLYDATNKEAIPFATVFFAGTTLGTTSNANGKYVLEELPPGKYDLVVSYVGYEISVKSLQIQPGEELKMDMYLKPEVRELQVIEVQEDTTGRYNNYLLFKSFFLGNTPYSKEVQIENPEVLHLYYDVNERTLHAHAKEPLIVINKKLGFIITYYLEEFTANLSQGSFFIFGIPFFTEMDMGKLRAKAVGKSRLEVYHGSVLHFMRSFYQDSLEQEKFEVHIVHQVPNNKRMPQSVIDEKLNYFKNTLRTNDNKMLMVSDSLRFWVDQKNMPVTVDSLGQRIYSGSEIKPDSQSVVVFTGTLDVKYMGAKESISYANQLGRSVPFKFQWSKLHFVSDQINLFPNGYYKDVHHVITEGYFSWTSNISMLLPLEYSPD